MNMNNEWKERIHQARCSKLYPEVNINVSLVYELPPWSG